MNNSKVIYLLRRKAKTYDCLSIDELEPCETTRIIAADNRMDGIY